MRDKFLKIKHKAAFREMLSIKLGVKPESLRPYLEGEKINIKHNDKIIMAIDLQLNLDKKINELTSETFINL